MRLGKIGQVLMELYAYIAIMPFAVFGVVWFAAYYLTQNKKKATTLAMDVTTACLVGVVSAQFDMVFGMKYGFWMIVLILLIGMGLIGNAQHRMRGSIDVRKQFRVVWRLGFVALSAFYIVFLMIGISTYVFRY